MSTPSSDVVKSILPPWPTTWSAPTNCGLSLTTIAIGGGPGPAMAGIWLDYPLSAVEIPLPTGEMPCHPPGMYRYKQTFLSPKPTDCPLGWKLGGDISITGAQNESTIYRCCSTGWRYYYSSAPLCASDPLSPSALSASPKALTAPGAVTALAVEAVYVRSSSEAKTGNQDIQTDTAAGSSTPSTRTSNTRSQNSSTGTDDVLGSRSGLSTGAKIGIGVGVPIVLLFLLGIGVFFYFWRRRRRERDKDNCGYHKPELDGTPAETFKAELDAADPKKHVGGEIHELPSPDKMETGLYGKDVEQAEAAELPAMPILPKPPLFSDGRSNHQETPVSPVTNENSTTWRNSGFTQENEALRVTPSIPRFETSESTIPSRL